MCRNVNALYTEFIYKHKPGRMIKRVGGGGGGGG
jgi:hypothetical protein